MNPGMPDTANVNSGTMHLSMPDAANGTMHLSMPDGTNGTMHLSMPDGTNGNAGSSGQPTFSLAPSFAVPFGGGAADLALTASGTTVANSLHIGSG
jgi:hypothetical protein